MHVFPIKSLLIITLVTAPIYGLTQTVNSHINLLDVYQDAVLYNSDIAVAKADYEAKQEAVPQARAGLLPTISAGATLESNRLSIRQPHVIDRNRSGTTFQANLNQPVFRLDRWFQLHAAKASTAQAELEYAEKEQLLILQTAEYYFEVLRTNDNLATSKTEEQAYKVQLEQTKGRLKGGIATITDVLDAQAAYDTASANRKIAERQVLDSYEQLTRLTKKYYESVAGISHKLPIEHPAPNESEHWARAAQAQNLGVLASEYNVKTANETYKQRQAAHAPTVDFVASHRQGDNDLMGYPNTSSWGSRYKGDNKLTSVSLQLTLPLYSGGMMSSQARESRKRLLQSEEIYESLSREVLLKTRNYFRALNSDIEQIKSRRQTMLSSFEALKANQVGVKVGTRNMMDVLNAQKQLYASVREYNNARYDYILNNLRLKQMTGILKVEDLQYLNTHLLPNYHPDRDFLPPELISITQTK